MRVIMKLQGRLLDLSLALDIYWSAAVDQNIGDSWIIQQRLERPESEYLVFDLTLDTLALRQT
jgi:hypothetical protein